MAPNVSMEISIHVSTVCQLYCQVRGHPLKVTWAVLAAQHACMWKLAKCMMQCPVRLVWSYHFMIKILSVFEQIEAIFAGVYSYSSHLHPLGLETHLTRSLLHAWQSHCMHKAILAAGILPEFTQNRASWLRLFEDLKVCRLACRGTRLQEV